MISKKTGMKIAMISGALLAALPMSAGAQTIERKMGANPNSPISASVSVPASANLLYLSGSTASPVDPAKPDELGDTKVQTLSILTKMKAQLEGMNEVFRTFFGTPEQPNKPARSTVQVAALGRPPVFVEIEAIVAKMP